jgi:hypothetical protein
MRRRPEQFNKRENIEFGSNPMRDKLLEIWDEQFEEPYDADDFDKSDVPAEDVATEAVRAEAQEYETLHEDLDQLDAHTIVEAYGYDASELKERDDGCYEMSVEQHFMRDRLPDGYGYKGGAARALLERNLGINDDSEPRDIDLIRLVDEEPSPGKDEELAKTYAPHDFEHGHGVEYVEDKAEYLETRDLTINELYATEHTIVATGACIKDSVRHILRVSDYERKQWGGTGPSMLAKISRFYTERIIDNGMAKIEDGHSLNTTMIRPFYLALNLDKAIERGYKYAKKYVEVLKDFGHFPEGTATVQDAVDYLNETMADDDFHFRNAPNDQFELEETWKDYEDLPKRLGVGKGHDAV